MASSYNTSGKFYWEYKWLQAPTGNCGVGFGRDDVDFATLASAGTLGFMVNAAGTINNNGSSTGISIGSFTTNDVACIAIDFTNKRGWFRRNGGNWNNNATYDPATNVGGVDLSAWLISSPVHYYFPAATFNAASKNVTANFGATSFAQAVPSGFTSGWTEVTPAAATGYTCWNVSDKNNNILLGDYALYAYCGTRTNGAARATLGRSTGKFYFEISVPFITAGGDQNAAGITLDTNTLASINSTTATSFLLYPSGGNVYNNGAHDYSFGNLSNGDTICYAIDLDSTNGAWLRLNNGSWNPWNGTADPATGIGGDYIGWFNQSTNFIFPVATFQLGTISFQGNFGGPGSFTYTPPSGFIHWDPYVAGAGQANGSSTALGVGNLSSAYGAGQADGQAYVLGFPTLNPISNGPAILGS
jgi:hypothetical protein